MQTSHPVTCLLFYRGFCCFSMFFPHFPRVCQTAGPVAFGGNPTQPAHDEVRFPEKIHWSWRSGYQHPCWNSAAWMMKLGTVVGGTVGFFLSKQRWEIEIFWSWDINKWLGMVVYVVWFQRCWIDGIPGSWKTVENHVTGWKNPPFYCGCSSYWKRVVYFQPTMSLVTYCCQTQRRINWKIQRLEMRERERDWNPQDWNLSDILMFSTACHLCYQQDFQFHSCFT